MVQIYPCWSTGRAVPAPFANCLPSIWLTQLACPPPCRLSITRKADLEKGKDAVRNRKTFLQCYVSHARSVTCDRLSDGVRAACRPSCALAVVPPSATLAPRHLAFAAVAWTTRPVILACPHPVLKHHLIQLRCFLRPDPLAAFLPLGFFLGFVQRLWQIILPSPMSWSKDW